MSDYLPLFEFLAVTLLPIAVVVVLSSTRLPFGVVAGAAVLASACMAVYSVVRSEQQTSDLGQTAAIIFSAITGFLVCAISLTVGAVVRVLTRRD